MDGVRGADLLWRQPVTVQEGSRGRGEMKQWWKNLAQEVCVSRGVCDHARAYQSRASDGSDSLPWCLAACQDPITLEPLKDLPCPPFELLYRKK
jgi:hypothetical protein